MGDNISDSELRRRLKDEFNFSCGPVTDTTRSIYLKKLDNFVKERNKESNLRRQTVAYFDSNNETNGNSPYLSGVRVSPRNVARRSMAVTVNTENERQTPGNLNEGSTRRTRASPNRSPKKNEALPRNTRRKTETLSAYSSEESAEEDPENSGSVLYNYMTSRKPKHVSQMRSTPTKVPLPRVTPSVAVTRKSTRGKISVPIHAASFLANYSDSEPENDLPSTESIRDRLLKHRQTRRKVENSNHSVVSPSKDEETNFFSSVTGSSSSSNWVSFTIVYLVIAFFVFILSLYVYSRFSFYSFEKGDAAQLELDVNAGSRGIVAPICDESGTTSLNCFQSSENVTAALFVVRCIQNFVQRTSNQYLCEDKVSQPDAFRFSMSDLRREMLLQKDKFCKFTGVCEDSSNSDTILFKSLYDAMTLIKLNPQWKILVEEVTDDKTIEYFLRIDPDTYQLILPFSCRAQLFLKKTLKYIVLSLIVMTIIWSVFTCVHKKRKEAVEIQEQIIDLVEKSIDLLQSPDNPQSVPVIHIRDMLFSTQERHSANCMKIWSKVVAFIEERESRVKVASEEIDGEVYKTWKWIAPTKSNEAKSTTMKTGTIEWQGQAFCDEKSAEANSAVNENSASTSVKKSSSSGKHSNLFAPTSYLKVRNMFTAETQEDPNWKINIENAILEKCSAKSPDGKHGVLHIRVEDQDSEGVVYIKCDSRDSATVAFHALHGWWCERKLVSVKFLKEERYYSRFPEARCFNEPLQIRHIYR